MHIGPSNALTDVEGLRVGHAELTGAGTLSGTTVVVAPPGGAVAGVDVRGAAPGTRETDLLLPGNTVERVHAIVLSGGSAYGLAAATGVMQRLEQAGEGFPVPGGVVPIVPAAVLFDLGRGGDFTARPTAETGAAAYDAAVSGSMDQGRGRVEQGVVGEGRVGDERDSPAEGLAGVERGVAAEGRVGAARGEVALGCVGAGRGAVAGGLKGGIGTASAVLDDGTTVAALVAVNAVGSAVDPATGVLLGARHGLPGEFPTTPPGPAAVEALAEAGRRRGAPAAGTATSLAVVATDATLDKAGCGRLATMGHDGFARALDPAHTVMDGDTVFGLATCARPAPSPEALFALHAAAAHVVSRAIAHAMLAAEPAATPAGEWPAYSVLTGWPSTTAP